MQHRRPFLLISATLFFILACNIGSSATPTQTPLTINGSIATSVEETLRASGVILATPVETFTPSVTPLPPLTATPEFTATPTIPRVSVSLNTNCRSGPGKVYDYLGALMLGEEAEVVGKYSARNYWIIKNPDAIGNCWLWGEYATVNGNTANLQEYIVPATPTPTIPLAPSNFAASVPVCGVTLDVTLSWTDNSNNEDGFNLYQDGVQTHILAYNQIQQAISIPFVVGQAITFKLSAYNVTGESAKESLEVVCP